MGDPLAARQTQILFIGGTGRSGTSITRELLGMHPLVATLPFEYRFIIDPDGIVDFYSSYTSAWSPYLADRRLKRLESFLEALANEPLRHRLSGKLLRTVDPESRWLSPRRYHGWRLEDHLPNFREHSQALLGALRDFSFPAYWYGMDSYTWQPELYHAGPKAKEVLAPLLGGFICNVIDGMLQKHGKKYFVEDNTWNILFARELLELVPQAHILHVYRDPRDVVASLRGQRWGPAEVHQAALWYRSIMNHWLAIRAELPPDRLFEFSLEALVHDTQHTISEVCAFSGIPYHPALLEADLTKSHSGRWRREFNAEEQQIVQDLLSEVLAKLGYENANTLPYVPPSIPA